MGKIIDFNSQLHRDESLEHEADMLLAFLEDGVEEDQIKYQAVVQIIDSAKEIIRDCDELHYVEFNLTEEAVDFCLSGDLEPGAYSILTGSGAEGDYAFYLLITDEEIEFEPVIRFGTLLLSEKGSQVSLYSDGEWTSCTYEEVFGISRSLHGILEKENAESNLLECMMANENQEITDSLFESVECENMHLINLFNSSRGLLAFDKMEEHYLLVPLDGRIHGIAFGESRNGLRLYQFLNYDEIFEFIEDEPFPYLCEASKDLSMTTAHKIVEEYIDRSTISNDIYLFPLSAKTMLRVNGDLPALPELLAQEYEKYREKLTEHEESVAKLLCQTLDVEI